MWRFSYNRFLAKLHFSCYSPCYKSAILFLCACVYIQRTRGRSLSRPRVDFSSVGRNRQSGMSMRLKKVCPQCDATLHVRKLACPCGHVFPTQPVRSNAWCIWILPRVLHFSAFMFYLVIQPKTLKISSERGLAVSANACAGEFTHSLKFHNIMYNYDSRINKFIKIT